MHLNQDGMVEVKITVESTVKQFCLLAVLQEAAVTWLLKHVEQWRTTDDGHFHFYETRTEKRLNEVCNT